MFIELDLQLNKEMRILLKININHIINFTQEDKLYGKKFDGTSITMSNGDSFNVANSYEEVSKKIDAALLSKSEIFGETMKTVGLKLFEKI